jgi:hypothetical protein
MSAVMVQWKKKDTMSLWSALLTTTMTTLLDDETAKSMDGGIDQVLELMGGAKDAETGKCYCATLVVYGRSDDDKNNSSGIADIMEQLKVKASKRLETPASS